MGRTLLLNTPLYAVYYENSLGRCYANFLTGQYENITQPALRHLTDRRSLAEIIRGDYPGIIKEFLLTDSTP